MAKSRFHVLSRISFYHNPTDFSCFGAHICCQDKTYVSLQICISGALKYSKLYEIIDVLYEKMWQKNIFFAPKTELFKKHKKNSELFSKNKNMC